MKKAWMIFAGIESAVYIAFLYFDASMQDVVLSTNIKYAGILLCLCWEVYVLTIQTVTYKSEYFKLIGMCFTAIADIFLLLLDQYYSIGVSAFCIVQISYLCSIISSVRARFIELGKRLVTVVILYFVILIFKINVNFLLLACLFYFVNLLFNMIASIKYKCHIFFLLGLILLCCCDVHVGLANSNMFDIFENNANFASVTRYFIWAYYLPSQVLIALSVNKTRKN